MKPHNHYYLFLDIDGVLAAHGGPHHGDLDPVMVQRLNTKVGRRYGGQQCRIVINSAWNVRGLGEVTDRLAEAGLDPTHIHDTTGSCQGGGEPVRRYLTENDLVGSPYVILDDSARQYGEMWCRLVKVDGSKGFDKGAAAAFDSVLWDCWRGLPERKERQKAVEAILEECYRLSKAKHLPADDKQSAIKALSDLLPYILTVPRFRERAFLIPSMKLKS